LQLAVRSALQQDYDEADYEVVVSDNGSDHRSEAVVKEMGAPNLRYLRTGGGLNMCDSWDFAASQAKGRYVGFLCDDDARTPVSLAVLADILDRDPSTELIAWRNAFYYHPDWPDGRNRNHLLLPKFTGDVVEEGSAHAIQRSSRFEFNGLPRMLNSMCSRDVASRIKKAAGRVFLPTAPDYTFLLASLAVTASFIYVDRPLYLLGASSESIGFSASRGGSAASHAYFQDFGVGPDELHPDVPLCPTATQSSILQSLINVARSDILSEGYHPYLPRYYQLLYSELRGWEANSIDISVPLQALHERLSSESGSWARDLQERMRADAPRRYARRWLNGHQRLSQFERSMRSLRRKEWQDLDGKKHGFRDILECACLLEFFASAEKGRRIS
jgi:glycosyltransferase involved in cell wall biosynthesis